MDATTMPSLSLLIESLQADYPILSFQKGDDFVWSPGQKTVFYAEDETNGTISLLHELAHALLGHDTYEHDIDLIAMETAAWGHVETVLAQKYAVVTDSTHIESHLDSYRDWLHQRSLCPTCGQTGLQTQTNRYSCMNCNGSWRVNDARRCRLRRELVTN